MEWKFPKVELTVSPRIKDHGMDYCKKEKKNCPFLWVDATLQYDTWLGEQSIGCFQS